MEGNIGPVEQMEAILKEESLKLAAEQTKAHAEMILLAACMNKPLVEGELLFKASSQGMDYMTGVMISVGLLARNWGRVLANDADLDFVQYLNTDAEAECADQPDDSFAHKILHGAMEIQTPDDANVLRTEMANFGEKHGGMIWGRAMVHYIGLCAELVNAVMEIRNGEVPIPSEGGQEEDDAK